MPARRGGGEGGDESDDDDDILTSSLLPAPSSLLPALPTHVLVQSLQSLTKKTADKTIVSTWALIGATRLPHELVQKLLKEYKEKTSPFSTADSR